MATQHRAIEYLIERMAGAGAVSAESMFGKHGVYVNDKMIGLNRAGFTGGIGL